MSFVRGRTSKHRKEVIYMIGLEILSEIFVADCQIRFPYVGLSCGLHAGVYV